MEFPLSLFYFVILILSIVIHEVAHGIAAERQGDPTARMLGRITLDPIKHIDIMGSLVLPALLLLLKAPFLIGWAKPVPYNPENFKNERKGTRIVSIAGVIANIGIAVFVGMLIRVMAMFNVGTMAAFEVMSIIVLVNVVLAVFNMIPIAPLDGFRFLESILPQRLYSFFRVYEQYGFIFLIAFLFFGVRIIEPIASAFYTLITGISL